MTITLNPANYRHSLPQIRECLRGEMCKIMKYERDTPATSTKYVIDTDVITGWFDTGFYHLTGNDGSWHVTGLGVFLLIRKMATQDGGCILEFTDDLNPDLP